MATTITLNTFKNEVIAQEITGSMDNITDAQFVALLNRAILNKSAELERDCPETVTGNATLTFAADSFEIALPTDMDRTSTYTFNLYANSDRNVYSLVQNDFYRVIQDKLRFLGTQNAGKSYYIEYRKEPSQYVSTINLSAQTLAESSNIRAKYYLSDEIRKLWWDAIHMSEASAAGNNQSVNSNRIS